MSTTQDDEVRTLARRGAIYFFHGPMYGEQGLEMVRQSKRAEHASRPKITPRWFKPAMDTFSKNVESRVGISYPAETLPSSVDAICARLMEAFAEPSIIGIDEVQFLCLPSEGQAINEQDVDRLHRTLVSGMRLGSQIFLAGLDTDFRGEPFPLSRVLLLDPRIRRKQMTAKCAVCCNDATMTQRLVDGAPAPRHTPTVVVKDQTLSTTNYEPRCAICHEIPD